MPMKGSGKWGRVKGIKKRNEPKVLESNDKDNHVGRRRHDFNIQVFICISKINITYPSYQKYNQVQHQKFWEETNVQIVININN